MARQGINVRCPLFFFLTSPLSKKNLNRFFLLLLLLASTRRPVTFFDLEARDLTGTVETVHLLPVARGENGDTWKGKWTGTFGTRQVSPIPFPVL